MKWIDGQIKLPHIQCIRPKSWVSGLGSMILGLKPLVGIQRSPVISRSSHMSASWTRSSAVAVIPPRSGASPSSPCWLTAARLAFVSPLSAAPSGFGSDTRPAADPVPDTDFSNVLQPCRGGFADEDVWGKGSVLDPATFNPKGVGSMAVALPVLAGLKFAVNPVVPPGTGHAPSRGTTSPLIPSPGGPGVRPPLPPLPRMLGVPLPSFVGSPAERGAAALLVALDRTDPLLRGRCWSLRDPRPAPTLYHDRWGGSATFLMACTGHGGWRGGGKVWFSTCVLKLTSSPFLCWPVSIPPPLGHRLLAQLPRHLPLSPSRPLVDATHSEFVVI